MENCIIAIDLGTTNFKFSVFDSQLRQIAIHSVPVSYLESNEFVEFDAEQYWQECKKGIITVIEKSKIQPFEVGLIALTGQAESIVLTDCNGIPLCNAISWRDTRSKEECEILSREFETSLLYETTGLPQISPTWPATKLLWIKRHNPELFKRISRILLIKDFITFKLSGVFVSEYSVFSFSCLLDQSQKKPWEAMCTYLEIEDAMLPELAEPGAIVGAVRKELTDELHINSRVEICIGALDHVAGMIGTGNITKGIVTEAAGTVQALSLKADSFLATRRNIEYHYGAEKNTYIELLVCESGGICFQWFRDTFLPSKSFKEIDTLVDSIMSKKSEIIFLPYISGLNSPEYDMNARGVFYGFHVKHEIADFARAVIEASCFLLRKNIDFLEENGQQISEIYSIGGASHSDLWCRIKADITGKKIVTFHNSESATLGVAIMGAVSARYFPCINEAVASAVQVEKIYIPQTQAMYDKTYSTFVKLYDQLFPIKRNSSWQ